MDRIDVLLCRVRERLCALPLAHVIETMRPLPVEPLAGTPPFVLGLALIRGGPTPVVDAAMLMGEPASTSPGRHVTIGENHRSDARRFALAVDSVVGIRDLGTGTLESLPPLMGRENAALVAAVGRLDASLLYVLSTVRVVPPGTWDAVDRRVSA